jgi:hypothetical protein
VAKEELVIPDYYTRYVAEFLLAAETGAKLTVTLTPDLYLQPTSVVDGIFQDVVNALAANEALVMEYARAEYPSHAPFTVDEEPAPEDPESDPTSTSQTRR